ncbi:unnamed protein product [Trichogramma brassicae]|uniref:Uncharacterized protein n=1 Tax=Trichogramma brassicae TaxID=86971 RepID=A0A6H5J639_9HYME|nr:unnamed protein product [Trichogramma brassicae]
MEVNVGQMLKSKQEDVEYTTMFFNSSSFTILNESEDIDDWFNKKVIKDIEKRIDEFTQNGSGWTLNRIIAFTSTIMKYDPTKSSQGAAYIPLPDFIYYKRACLFQCLTDLVGLLALLNEVRPSGSTNDVDWRMGVAMLRVYLLRLQMSRRLEPPWPVYVPEKLGCHQEDWDPELSGVLCSVCNGRLDAPPPAAQEAVPSVEFPDDEVGEIHLPGTTSIGDIVALGPSSDCDTSCEVLDPPSDSDNSFEVYTVLSDSCDNSSKGSESSC